MIMGCLLIFAAAMHFAFPQFTDAQAHAVSNFAGTVLEKVAGMAPVERSTVSVAQQATSRLWTGPRGSRKPIATAG